MGEDVWGMKGWDEEKSPIVHKNLSHITGNSAVVLLEIRKGFFRCNISNVPSTEEIHSL